jgi:deazaflavin-dependent oxidoreductase (nitroreductase family)
MSNRSFDEEQLRQAFKRLNKFMVTLWRLGLGKWVNFWPAGIGRIMVITHTGRKSGRRYRTPVNYAIVDQEVYCITGFGAKSDWYRNLLARPEVEVWLPDGWWQGIAEDVSEAENRLAAIRAVMIASGFAAPLFEGIDPKKLSDDELAKISGDYRLVRIRRAAALTGLDGPGDLAWVWPLATFLLLPLALRRRRR